MKKTMTAALIFAVGLALMGCGNSSETTLSAPTVEAAGGESTALPTGATDGPTAEAAKTTAAPSKSTRGNLIKGVGIAAGMADADTGEQTTSFVITAIEVDPKCARANAEPAENGHFVVLTVEAQTTPALAEIPYPVFSLGVGSWKAIAANGTTQNQYTSTGASFSCVDSAEQFPASMGPDEKATGKIVLDVVSPSGILIFSPEPGLGWEWEYPAK